MFAETISQASACLSDTDSAVGMTFNEIHHVATGTGVFGIYCDKPNDRVDSRQSVRVGASFAPGATTLERSTIFDRSSCVVGMTFYQSKESRRLLS